MRRFMGLVSLLVVAWFLVPEGFVPDPLSVEADKAWRTSIESRLNALKLAPQTNVLGYAKKTTNQLGVGFAPVTLAGLTLTVTVGTRRLVRLSVSSVLGQKTGVNGEWEIDIYESGGPTGGSSSVTTVLGAFDTQTATAIIAPTVGTHTYYVVAQVDAGGVDIFCSSVFPAYFLVEDIGLAPA